MATPDEPCAAPEQRQFDFWLGDWEVRTPDGELAGHNRISRVVGGCGLLEEWRGRSGLVGTSLNTWSAERRVWHQMWIDSNGTLLLLEGEFNDGAMLLQGETLDAETRAPIKSRIGWSLIDDDPDRLRQHWEFSRDGSAWETHFDGRYTRRADG